MACESGIWPLHPNMYVLGGGKSGGTLKGECFKIYFYIHTPRHSIVSVLSFNHMCAMD